jgi:hypothetical protein
MQELHMADSAIYSLPGGFKNTSGRCFVGVVFLVKDFARALVIHSTLVFSTSPCRCA